MRGESETASVWNLGSVWRGRARGVLFHIWRAAADVALFWSCVSALSPFPFPPRTRSLTPPFFFLYACVCVCVVFFFFFFFCLSVRTAKFVQPHKLGWGIESLRVVSTMGDVEAPDSTQPRQSVLLAVLPSKEFATSRKGMLLIAEVVRHGSRSRDGRVSHSAPSAPSALWPRSLSCLLDLRKRA